MVRRDGRAGGLRSATTAAAATSHQRAMHSTDNAPGLPGDSAKLCCGPPSLGFELGNKQLQQQQQQQQQQTPRAAQSAVTRGLQHRQGQAPPRALQPQPALASTAAGSPPHLAAAAATLLETGSLGDSSGGAGSRGIAGGTSGSLQQHQQQHQQQQQQQQPGGAVTASAVSAAQGETVARECAGCGKIITERFLLKALDMYWHEDCLKCGCCDCRLGEVGSTLYTKANLILCKRDYLRLFGTTGYCAACSKVIPAFEMVMRAKSNVYHLECFACQQCNHRFCVGDRFYLCDNKILCEYDYEERLVFANMAYNPSSLAHIRRQVGNLQPSGDDLMQQQQPLCGGPPSSSSSSTGCPPPSGVCSSTLSGGHLGPPAPGLLKSPWSPGRAGPNLGDEEASSGYGSPDSQPPEPAPAQQPPSEAR